MAPTEHHLFDESVPTHLQEGLWAVECGHHGTTIHHVYSAWRITGGLSVRALASAIEDVSATHDALRLVVRSVEGAPRVWFDPQMRAAITEQQITDHAMLPAALRADAARAFALDVGPLFRVTVFTLPPMEHVILLCAHQMAVDATSLGALWHEILEGYTWQVSGKPRERRVAASFQRWASRERARIEGGELDAQLAYWGDHLRVPVPALTLGFDHPAVASASSAGTVRRVIPPALRAMIMEKSAEGIAPRVVVLSAFQALLYRYTSEDDLTVAELVSVRTDSAHADIGTFTNLVVVRATLAPTMPFGELLTQTRERHSGAYVNREYPLSRLVEKLAPARRSECHPYFQVAYAFTDTYEDTVAVPAGLQVEPVLVERIEALAELVLHVQWNASDAELHLDFDGSVITRRFAERTLSHLVALLQAGLASPASAIADLRFFGEAEQAALDAMQNGPAAPHEAFPVGESIRRWALTRPDSIAVSQGKTLVTYRELWDAAHVVGATLRAQGVGTGSVVGVCLRRRPELPGILLGIWMSGAAFLPLDPQFPPDRLRAMVADASCRVVVADSPLPWLPEHVSAMAFEVAHAAGSAPEFETVPFQPNELAYVIYTSGSTGAPKGVEVTHAALANLLQSMAIEPGLHDDDILLAVTTLSFDIAQLELWLPLRQGARLELAEEDDLLNPAALIQRISSSGVTVMQATPSTWRMLVAAEWSGHLRMLLCGGEAFPADLVDPLRSRADLVFNLYGPTETTIWSTIARIGESCQSAVVPIGRPIHNTRVYIMDRRGRPSPIGSIGEIWIGGAGVARGYRNQPALTIERFVPEPHPGTGVAYRTGDLGRWNSAGELVHHGRIDSQIKISGFRIEPGEIEHVLQRIPAVRHAVAAVSGPSSDARLVAYVVFGGARQDRPSSSEIRRVLRGRLPEYMIPSMIIEVESIPLTPNGKLDRRALPDPFTIGTQREQPFEAPHTEIECAIARVWSELLKVPAVSRFDNFFELGGHSLLAVRATWRLERQESIVLDPRAMFFCTLAQLAEGAR